MKKKHRLLNTFRTYTLICTLWCSVKLGIFMAPWLARLGWVSWILAEPFMRPPAERLFAMVNPQYAPPSHAGWIFGVWLGFLTICLLLAILLHGLFGLSWRSIFGTDPDDAEK